MSRMKKINVWFIGLSIASILLATGAWSEWRGPHTPANAVTKEGYAPIIMKMIEDLCNISGFGIQSGIHPGPTQDKALQYIVKKLGDPRLNVRTEPAWYSKVPTPFPLSWEVTALGATPKVLLTFPEKWSVGTPPEGITAPVAYVREGTESYFKMVDVKGKIVVIDKRHTNNVGTTDSIIGGSKNALKYGAVGVILADTVIEAPKLRSAGTASALFGIPVFTCGKTDGDILRNLATSGGSARIKLNLDPKLYDSYTIIAQLKGNGSMEEIIMCVCHYDSAFTGAVDSNSSIATMIAMANYFASKPVSSRNRDMWFVFSTGHDASFNQLDKFAEEYKDILPKTIVYDIDHPVAGEGFREIGGVNVPTGKDAYIKIYPSSGELASLAAFSLQRYGWKSVIVHQRIPGGGANTGGLREKGAASLDALVSEPPWYYHTIYDTPDRITLDEIERSFPTNVEIVENIDRTPEGYLLYANINRNVDIPTTPIGIGVTFLKETVLAGDPVVGWLDYLDVDRVVHSYPQLPDDSGLFWDWGDGTPVAPSSRVTTGVHVYKNPGTYQFTLGITDLKGIKGSVTKTITVLPAP